MMPDWTTFNGYANQYVTHPLTADPGETTRFWVVAAGPTLDTNFHVVGTIFDRAWVNGDMTNPPQEGVQTVGRPRRRRRRVRRQDRRRGHVPVRLARLRPRRPRSGRACSRSAIRRGRRPTDELETREPPAGRLPRLRSTGDHHGEPTSQPTVALRSRAGHGRHARSHARRRQPGRCRRRHGYRAARSGNHRAHCQRPNRRLSPASSSTVRRSARRTLRSRSSSTPTCSARTARSGRGTRCRRWSRTTSSRASCGSSSAGSPSSAPTRTRRFAPRSRPGSRTTSGTSSTASMHARATRTPAG